MAELNTLSHDPSRFIFSDLSLEDCEDEHIEWAARFFWDQHNLRQVVTKQEFVLGALIMHNSWIMKNLGAVRRHLDEKDGEEFGENTGQSLASNESTEHQYQGFSSVTYQQRLAFAQYFYKCPKDSFKFFQKQHEPRDYSEKRVGRDFLGSLSTMHLMILSMCCLAALTQGWHQASLNGANLEWPSTLGISYTSISALTPNEDADINWNVWIFALINAAPFWSGAFFGLFVSDPMINELWFGRRWAIALSGVSSIAAVIGSAFSPNWKFFLAFRFLLGFGMGGKASVVPIYLSEVSPHPIRGMLAMSWQISVTLGLFVGGLVNFVMFLARKQSDHSDWRMMIALPFIPALMFLTLIFFCVESPRWLLKKNQMQKALKAFIRLHDLPSPVIACGDMFITYLWLKYEERSPGSKIETEIATPEAYSASQATTEGTANSATDYSSQFTLQNTTLFQRARLIWNVRRNRNALYAAASVMFAQQACGINILALMSSSLYESIRSANEPLITSAEDTDSKRDTLMLSMITSFINFAATWLAFPLIDRKGRRFVLNISFFFMGIFLISTGGVLFQSESDSRAVQFFALTMVFVLFYSVGEGPAAFVISSEVFPLGVRELGMSIAVFINFFFAGVLALLIPYASRTLVQGWFWIVFGLINFGLLALCFVFVQETHNLRLEEIDQIYDKYKIKHFWENVEANMESLKKYTVYVANAMR